MLDAFPDGVWSVRLARLTDPELVVATIAATLDVKEAGGTPIADMLRAQLRDKALLLMLDNFEHVAAAAPQVAEVLESCPAVRALVTSRVPLRLRGEHEFALRPLALPDLRHLPPPERLSQYAAVALFIELAQAAQADFQVTNATAPAVAEICARLDGLPLAIELAAAWIKLLPPPALLKRLAHALPVLTGGARDVDERQRTMRNTLAWSYDLLAPEERRLFRRRAVFVGGCTLEAAEAVCVAPEGAAPLGLDVLDGLRRLVDQSLVQQREEGGEPRFGMLHVIREFALEQIEASGEAEALRRAHLAFYQWLAETHEDAVWGPKAQQWLGQSEHELNNFRAALAWAQEIGELDVALRVAWALMHTWDVAAYYSESRGWLEWPLAQATGSAVNQRGAPGLSAATHAKALCALGGAAWRQGDHDVARAAMEASVTLGRNLEPHWALPLALSVLGHIAWDQGDLETAAARLDEAVALTRACGPPGLASSNTADRSLLASQQGDFPLALASYEESMALAQQAHAELPVGDALGALADVARRRGDLASAERYGREQLLVWPKLRARGYLAGCLEGLAFTAAAGRGAQVVRSVRLLGATSSLREQLGAPMRHRWQADMERAIAAGKAALGEEAWAEAFAAGRMLSLEEAIAEALGDAREPDTVSAQTPRARQGNASGG